MPYRPSPEYRRNIRGVIYPLTAAIVRLFGSRPDGAYPIGAFYTSNIQKNQWRSIGGIWYQPTPPIELDARNIREEDIEKFLVGITFGRDTVLRSSITVKWEPIPFVEAAQLPPIAGARS